MEPILIGHAAERGSRVRFDTEYCVLVRPDVHVGWRAFELAADPEAELTGALARLLDRGSLPGHP